MKTIATLEKIKEEEKREATERARKLSKAIYKEADSLKKELVKGFRAVAQQHAAQEPTPGGTRNDRIERLKSSMRATTENAVNAFLKKVGLDTQITFEMVNQWRAVRNSPLPATDQTDVRSAAVEKRQADAKVEADAILRKVLKKGEKPHFEEELQQIIHEGKFHFESRADAVLSTCNQIFYQAEAFAESFDQSREHRGNISWEITKSVALIIIDVTAFVAAVALFLTGIAFVAAGISTLNPLPLIGGGIVALSIAIGSDMPSDIAKDWETLKKEISEARTGISADMEKGAEDTAEKIGPHSNMTEGTDPANYYRNYREDSGLMTKVALSLQSYCESHLQHEALSR